jgi:hypothetical protein
MQVRHLVREDENTPAPIHQYCPGATKNSNPMPPREGFVKPLGKDSFESLGNMPATEWKSGSGPETMTGEARAACLG